MDDPIYLDVETVGFHGVPVLLQYAVGDGSIILWSIWTEPIEDTLRIIESIVNHPGGLIFFNATFDWFHICKIYTMLSLWPNRTDYPEDIINELASLERQAMDGPCLKPVTVLDLMLHARKGKYQSMMNRGDIIIRKVPTTLAWQLAEELERRVKLKDIYFARRKKKTEKWKVLDIDLDGEIDPNFKNVVLKFAPSTALKVLAADALNLDPSEVIKFLDVAVDDVYLPVEFGYAPFAAAASGGPGDWKGAWPDVIHGHIAHWLHHETARKYAALDVDYLRQLYVYFNKPAMGDDDSILSTMVAAVRWRGFKIDIPKLEALKIKSLAKIGNTPMNPRGVRYHVSKNLSETEKLILKGSTKRVLLEEIAKFTIPCSCAEIIVQPDLVVEKVHDELLSEVSDITDSVNKFETVYKSNDPNCPLCKGLGSLQHPAAICAQEVLDARKATKKIETIDKLLKAGRFHASFKVIGTLSSRMSGADDLNAQGVDHTYEFRDCFPLAFDGTVLDGGDFSGFEPTIADAKYNDPTLRADLLTCEVCEGHMEWNDSKDDFICQSCGSNKGKKIHALFGVNVFPHMTYDQIKATAKTANDIYDSCKKSLLALFYGAEGFTLLDRLGVDLETANEAVIRFFRKYPKVGSARQRIKEGFCSLTQPDGIGSRVIWSDPQEYIESMFGHRRYFTLENMICRTLYDLADKPPRHWKDIKVKVMRRDRVQMAESAVRSALFGAAFGLQASNMRASCNHEIQASGSQITKRVQCAIWGIQPVGINPWRTSSLNVHDEILCINDPNYSIQVQKVVKTAVAELRKIVPLLSMPWKKGMKSWAEK